MDFKSSLSLTRCFAFALVMRCAQNGISNENISCSQFMRNFRYGWRNWSQKYVKRREKKNLIMLAHSQYVTLKYIYIICKSLWTTFYIICSLSVFVSFSSSPPSSSSCCFFFLFVIILRLFCSLNENAFYGIHEQTDTNA